MWAHTCDPLSAPYPVVGPYPRSGSSSINPIWQPYLSGFLLASLTPCSAVLLSNYLTIASGPSHSAAALIYIRCFCIPHQLFQVALHRRSGVAYLSPGPRC